VKTTKPSKKAARYRKTARGAAPAKKQAARKEGKAKKKSAKASKTAKLAKPAKPAKSRKAPPAKLPRPPSAELQAVRPIDERGKREALAFAKAVVAAALDKKAIEPVLIDVCGRVSYADFIVVVSGRSDRQVDAVAEGVCEAMARLGRRPLGREGAGNGRWVLIDFGDVVMHVFYHPLRQDFDLESLWIDAPRVKLQIPAEARADALPGHGSGS
jgi:ribosome-associated protein